MTASMLLIDGGLLLDIFGAILIYFCSFSKVLSANGEGPLYVETEPKTEEERKASLKKIDKILVWRKFGSTLGIVLLGLGFVAQLVGNIISQTGGN